MTIAKCAQLEGEGWMENFPVEYDKFANDVPKIMVAITFTSS